MEVVASLSQGRTASAQCGLFTHKSVPVIFEAPCTKDSSGTFRECTVCDPVLCAFTECTTTMFCIWPDDKLSELKHVAEFFKLITNIYCVY